MEYLMENHSLCEFEKNQLIYFLDVRNDFKIFNYNLNEIIHELIRHFFRLNLILMLSKKLNHYIIKFIIRLHFTLFL